MDTTGHLRYIPVCPPAVALVDQYNWKDKDAKLEYGLCNNGIGQPIYNCQGNISRSLPLEMYPKVNEIHPEVRMMQNYIYDKRYPRNTYKVPVESYAPVFFNDRVGAMLEPGKLPSPDVRSCAPCQLYR